MPDKYYFPDEVRKRVSKRLRRPKANVIERLKELAQQQRKRL